MYVPVYLGESLRYVCLHIHMNIEEGNTSIDLMKYFPLLKKGYALHSTVDWIICNYIDMNNGITAEMNAAFNGDIAAEFYRYRGIDISMSDAVSRGLIPNPMNSFSVLKLIYSRFRLKNFRSYIRELTLMNCHFIKEFSQFNSYLSDEEFLSQITYECELAKEIWELIKLILHVYVYEETRIRNHGTKVIHNEIITINLRNIVSYTYEANKIHMMEQLLLDEHSKLLSAIIIQDYNMVEEFLVDIDPRLDGYQAYKTALTYDNQTIITIIEKKIIERNWYEKQILCIMIESLIGKSELPDVLYYYIRNML